jgi:hypothetical protein
VRFAILTASILALGFIAWEGDAAAAAPVDRQEDLRRIVENGIKAGSKRIVIPPGRYRVRPVKRQHLLLKGVKDVEIVADGVEMVCTETTRALTMVDCRNVTLRGLTIDYDPLPFTQGRIVGLSEDKTVHDIELFDGYPASDAVREFKYEIYRADTRTLRFGSYYGFTVEKRGPKRIRVTRKGRYQGEEIGDTIVIGSEHAPGGQIPHAVCLERCESVVLECVALYASNCFGFLESECVRTTYRKCVIDRRPSDTDLKKRGSPRARSLNADAYHSKHAVVGPTYTGCTARFQGDDCVAINGDYHMIMKAGGRVLRVLAKRKLDIRPGDPVELVSYTGARLPDAKAVSVEPDGRFRPEEDAFIRKQHLDANLKTRRNPFFARAYRVTLDREVDLPMGSVIASGNRIGNGFVIENGRFGFNRSRGAIIKASRGEIRGNRFEGCQMASVLLAPEYWWMEAGSGDDVIVRDNVIRNTPHCAIEVLARGGNGKTAPAGAHNDIVIRDNRIEGAPRPAIRVTSTKGLTIAGNRLDLLPGKGGPIDLQQVEAVDSK